LAELTDRAASLLRFLEHHADADGLVRPESGVNYHTIPQRWVEFESANVPLGGGVEATSDDFEETLSELVLKHRVFADLVVIKILR
jgi:hypothetical protein